MRIAGQTAKPGRRLIFSLAASAQLIVFVFACGLIGGCKSTNHDTKQLLWKYSAPRRSHWTANGSADRPVVAGDLVLYKGGYPDRNEIYLNVVDLRTGKKMWSSPNSVSQYIISGDTVFYTTIDSMTTPQPGKKKKEWIRAVDISTGKSKWEKLIETNYGSLQFLADSSFLYMFTNDAEICAVNKATGEIAWNQTLPSVSSNSAYTPASVAAVGDIIFVAMPDHTISVIDGTAGKVKSVIPGLRSPSAGGRRTIMPAGSLIVLVDSDGFVSTVNGNTARISTPVETGPLQSQPSIDETAVYLSAAESSTKLPSDRTEKTPSVKGNPGAKKAEAKEAKKENTPHAESGSLAPKAQRYLCAIAVDNITPTFKWQTNVNGLVNQPPVLNDNMLVVGTADGAGEVLALKKKTGDFLWSYESGPITGRPAINLGVVFASGKNDVMALDASTGKLLWRYQLENTTPASGPIISGNILLMVGRDSNLYAVKLDKSTTKTSSSSTTTKKLSITLKAE